MENNEIIKNVREVLFFAKPNIKNAVEPLIVKVSEQSQRIQQLEGLLKRVLQYNFEPRHPEHPVYKLISEIKTALNL